MKFKSIIILASALLAASVPKTEEVAVATTQLEENEPIFGPGIDTMVFPAVGTPYIRGKLKPNTKLNIYYSPLRLFRQGCPYVIYCFKYKGLRKDKRCSKIYSRAEAVNMSATLPDFGSVTFDITLASEKSVCAEDNGHKFTVRKGVLENAESEEEDEVEDKE